MEATADFLTRWDSYMYIGAGTCLTLGVLILLYHEFNVFKIRDFKEKYDYVNLHEISYFGLALIALIAAATFYGNTIGSTAILSEGLSWIYVRAFITVSVAITAYIIFFSLIRIYYPSLLEKRLSKLRNTPRKSPGGNVMRKLTEAEEDHHLEQLMIDEEAAHAIDYDVWVDEKTGYKKIEKYPAFQHAEECAECGYFTLKIQHEEIERAPTSNEEGYLLMHYKCTYCAHREQREIIVTRLSKNVA